MSNLGFDDNYSLDRVEQILREDGMDILNDEMRSCLNLEVKVDKDVEINYEELNIRITDYNLISYF
jgi:hypothetical protein